MKRIYLSLLLTFSIRLMQAALPAPVLVSPQNAATNQEPNVLLDWSPVSGANGYEYRIANNPAMNDSQLFSVGNTSQASTFNLRFGTSFYWQVRARKTIAPADSSDWSVVWNFTTLDQLTPFSPLSGSSGKEPEVLLDWSGISGITAYDYQWDTSASFNSPVSYYGSFSSSQAYTFQLRFGAKYYWRVRGRHAADTTQWSAVWNFSTLDQLTPFSPLSGSSGKEPEVLLDWSGFSGITAYDYQWDTSAAFNSPVSYYGSFSSSQAYTFQLRFGAKYFWRVRGRHAADTTQWSAVWNFSTLDQLTPFSPLSGSSGKEPEVLLDWSGISGITAYDYQWDTSAAFNSPVSYYGSFSSSQAYTFQLRFGAKYYWRVRGRHAADTMQWSAVWNFSTLDQLTPFSPLSGSSGKEPEVLLDWSGISGIAAYDYQWDTSAAFNSPVSYYGSFSSSQAYTFQLRFGAKYYWRVRARHAADTSQWSVIWNFSTLEYLSLFSPANGSANVNLNPQLDWAGINGISTYQYRFSPNADFQNASLVTSTASLGNLINLLYGTTYFWQVRACHGADTSDWNPAWSFTTLYQISSAPLLLSPANVAQNVPFSGTSLEWSALATASFYEYQLDDDQSFTSAVNGTESGTSALTGDLLPSTTYHWRVRAGNGSGYSAWSEIRSFTTETATKTNETIVEDYLSIIPNPCDGLIQISIGGKAMEKNALASLFTLNGKLIQKFELGLASSVLDLRHFQKGIYLLRISWENKLETKKLIIR